MIDIPKTPDYDKQVKSQGKFPPCIVCGRPIKNPNHPYHLHMTVDGMAVSVAEAENLPDDEDQGCFPVGADCIRNHPELKPYII